MEALFRSRPNHEPPSPTRRLSLLGRMRRGRSPSLVFDPRICSGCRTCEMVCSAQEGTFLSPASAGIRVIRDEEKGKAFAVFCQHCRDPLCMDVCPTKAISKAGDGIVRIDPKACVHCGLCAMACPEAAPLANPADGRIHKCDLCDGDPECVKQCPERALSFSKGRTFPWIGGLRWAVQAVSFLLLVVVLVGTFCSLGVGKFQISCPLGVLQNIASSKTFIIMSAASGLAIIVLCLAAGRIFCGWICPFGFILDIVGGLAPGKRRWPSFLKARAAKYGVLTASVGGSLAMGFQAFCPICPIGTVCRSYGVQGSFRGYELAVLPALAALEIGERRAWCRYFCPVGALLALAAKFAMVRIFIGARKCKKFSCKRCADICPMGIIDHRSLQEGRSPDVPMEECILCMRCVDQCPYDAAKVRFRWWRGAPKEARP